MALEPTRWSVVVVGSWNRAILTPSGIAWRIFGLDKGTSIEVLVPIDTIGPFIVKHDNFQVFADDRRLTIQPVASSFQNLERAMELANTAVTSLPETPLSATGFNLRFEAEDPSQSLQDVIGHDYDSKLEDLFTVSGKSYHRSVEWKDGEINVSVERTADCKYVVQLNFDQTSPDIEKLKSWLQIPISEIEKVSAKIARDFLSEEISDKAGENGNVASE